MRHGLSGQGPGLGAASRVALSVVAGCALASCLSISPAMAVYFEPLPAPSVVRDVQSTPVDHGQTTVTWTAPEYDGGSPITSYTIRTFDSHGNETSDDGVDVSGSAHRAIVTGLVDGQTYHFDVVANTDASSSVDSYVDPISEPEFVNENPLDQLAVVMEDLRAAQDPAVIAGYADTWEDPDQHLITFYWKGVVPASIREKFAPDAPGVQVKFVQVPFSVQEMDPQFVRVSAGVEDDPAFNAAVHWSSLGANFQTGTIDLEYCTPPPTGGATSGDVSPQDVLKFVAPFTGTVPVRALKKPWPCEAVSTDAASIRMKPRTANPAGARVLGGAPLADSSGHELISLGAQISGRPLP